jgi:hypothetical protein
VRKRKERGERGERLASRRGGSQRRGTAVYRRGLTGGSRACTRRGGEQRRVDDICVVASFRGGPVVQSHKEESRK